MTGTESTVVRRSWLTRMVEAGSRLVRTLDFREPAWVRPLPRVDIRLGRWVPAWVLNVSAAAVAVACVAMVATSRPEWVLALVLVALMVLRPAGAPPALFALWLGLQAATSAHATYASEAAGLILGLHLVAVLLTTAADLHPWARVELRVLIAPLRRLVVIQALVQPVAWATMSLAAGDVTVRWLPVVAALGLVVASWVLARRVSQGV